MLFVNESHAQSFSMSMPNSNFVLIPGGGFETHAMITVDPGQIVHLSTIHPTGIIAYFQPNTIHESQMVYLLVICPDSNLSQHQTITAIARQNDDSITKTINVYNANDGHGFYNIEKARAYLDSAFIFLEQTYPSQATYLESVHQLNWQACFPYPPLLVVTHHLFVNQDWRVEVLWHEMIPPHNWTKMFVYNESLDHCWGVNIDTYGQYSVIPCEITHYIFQDTITGMEEDLPKQLFELFPNPCNGTLHCSMQAEMTSMATLVILDLNGKALLRHRISPMDRFLAWDISALAPGLYIVNCEAEGFRQVEKIVIR